MKRFRYIILLIAVASVLSLALGYARTRILRSHSGSDTSVARQSSPQAQPQPINVGSFVARGMPVQFTEIIAKNDKGSADLSYTLGNDSGGEIGGLDLALLAFNTAGKLMGIQTWSVQTKVEASARQSFSLKLRHRVATGDRLVLCVESIRGAADFWHVDFNELSRAISASVSGENVTPPEVSRRAEKIPESFGGAYCSDAFARAFRLARAGDGKGLTSFTCDRGQRFSSFRFKAKDLRK